MIGPFDFTMSLPTWPVVRRRALRESGGIRTVLTLT